MPTVKQHTPSCQTIQSLRLFGQACLGVVIGVLLALALARLLLPPDGPAKTLSHGLLPWIFGQLYLKPREKGLYLLSIALGGVCGYGATFRLLSGRAVIAAIWAALLLSIPLFNQIIGHTLIGHSSAARIFATLGSAAAIIGGLFTLLLYRQGRPLADVEPWPTKSDDGAPSKWQPFLLLLLLLTLILMPSSFAAVAAKIGLNFPPVSFLFGPALYFLGHGLLPGIDYYSQYSIGQPWLFHFIIGHSIEQTLIIYTTIVIVATWLFYAHAIYLLHWLYRSWTAAGVVALLSLILGFHYPGEHQAFFIAPSSSVLRFPLLTACAVLTGFWSEVPGSPSRLLAAALGAAGSIFLETETGIIFAITAPVALFATHPWRSSIILPIAAFVAATIVIFVAAILVVFGSSAWQTAFFADLFTGLVYFGSAGLGGVPMNWTLAEWNWFYHLVVPGALIATLCVIARSSGTNHVDRRRAAVLAFLAVSGLLLLVKYVNQSLASVWQMSAIVLLAVLGWWCVAVLNHIDPAIFRRRIFLHEASKTRDTATARPALSITTSLRSDAALAMIALALIFAYSPSEARNPGQYGLRAWSQYPSLLKRPFRRPVGCVSMDCVANLPAASDVALIASRTQPGQQVAIVVDSYDAAYLVDAHRPPLILFLPSAQIFTEGQVKNSLERLQRQDHIFTPKDADGGPFNFKNDMTRAVAPLLGTMFQKDDEGDRLIAWKHVAQ
jgi:hypothetical protein